MSVILPNLIGTYDPNQVEIISTLDVISGDGPEPMSGFAEGTFINLSRNEDLFNSYVGTRGEVSRAINRNQTYTLTFTLQQTSEWNGKLFNLVGLETIGASPKDIAYSSFIIRIPDLVDIEITESWIMSMPDVTLSGEIEAYEWTFFCTNAVVQNLTQLV